MRVFQYLPENWLDNKFLGIQWRILFPIILTLVMIAGLLSPLFNLSDIHGFPPPAKLYAQHLYLDACAGLGGYYAATLCKHLWHRIAVMLFVDLVVTFLLVTIVG